MSKRLNITDLSNRFKRSERMPVVFLGHGSPMNAIMDTKYSRSWQALGKSLPKPQAILVVSAHWVSKGNTLVDISNAPATIHDFYGFPEELYNEKYSALGSPELATKVASMLEHQGGKVDDTWGLDHGSWSVLKYLFPDADVPVFQMSIDMSRDLKHQLEVGAVLKSLRDHGVLILGSGNIVHNLSRLSFSERTKPEDFAVEFDALFSEKLLNRDFDTISDRSKLGTLLDQAHPSVDHYLPALTIAGTTDMKDELVFMTDNIDLGSISMRSFVFHN